MRVTMFAGLLALLSAPALAQTQIDSINTSFRWLGPDDKIVVERYDDPRVQNVSCYLSRATTGGIEGGLGVAEDPSRFSLGCRAVGPVTVPDGMPPKEIVAFSSASLFFKTFQIHRADKRLPVQQHQRGIGRSAVRLIGGNKSPTIAAGPSSAHSVSCGRHARRRCGTR